MNTSEHSPFADIDFNNLPLVLFHGNVEDFNLVILKHPTSPRNMVAFSIVSNLGDVRVAGEMTMESENAWATIIPSAVEYYKQCIMEIKNQAISNGNLILN